MACVNGANRPISVMFVCLWLTMPSVGNTCALSVEDAYIQLAFPNARVGALYLQIQNSCPASDQLMIVRSHAASKVEIHQTVQSDNGVMSMVKIDGGLTIPPMSELKLAPGGFHVMLMGLELPKNNHHVEVTLDFDQADDIVLTLPVRLKPR